MIVIGVVSAGVDDLLRAGRENSTNIRRLVASNCSGEVRQDCHDLAWFERLVHV
jgi:hypothetical protein